MKKFIHLLLIGSASLFLLAGCNNSNASDNAKLQSKVDQLEKELEELKGSQDMPAETARTKETEETKTQKETGSPKDSESASVTLSKETQDTAEDAYNIDIISQDVSAAVEAAKAAVPTGSQTEQRDQFFAIKNVLKDLDHTLDQYEDYLEQEYRSGRLDLQEYHAAEKVSDDLEDQLDDAENFLERAFGIDD